MKVTLKHFFHGGTFSLIANLAAFLLFTVSVIFPFDLLQAFVPLCILFVPGMIYHSFASRHTVFFALGMLAGNIIAVGICLLLDFCGVSITQLIAPLVYGEVGLLFGIEFVLEFFLRIISLTAPPIIHIFAHAIGSIKNRRVQKSH